MTLTALIDLLILCHFLKIAGYHPDNQQFQLFQDLIILHTTHQPFMPILRKIRLIIRHNLDDIIKIAIFKGQKHSHFSGILMPFFIL